MCHQCFVIKTVERYAYRVAGQSNEVVWDFLELFDRREDVRIFTSSKSPILVDQLGDCFAPERLGPVELATLQKYIVAQQAENVSDRLTF